MSVTAVADTEGDTLVAPPNFLERATSRIFAELSADAEDWAEMAGPVCRYPWTHFIKNPDSADLRRHKATLERMIAFGELLCSTTNSPAFPDKEIAAIVNSTLRMLKDDLAMWHGRDLTDAQGEKLMQECFPE